MMQQLNSRSLFVIAIILLAVAPMSAASAVCVGAGGQSLCTNAPVPTPRPAGACVSLDDQTVCASEGSQVCVGAGWASRCLSTSIIAGHKICIVTTDTIPTCVTVEP